MFEPGSFGNVELPVVAALRSISRETLMLATIKLTRPIMSTAIRALMSIGLVIRYFLPPLTTISLSRSKTLPATNAEQAFGSALRHYSVPSSLK
jgi:hypothetical protein